jgi:hypothetical protein
MRRQPCEIAVTRLLLQTQRQALHSAHALVKSPMQRRPNSALERLEQKNEHEEQNAGRALRRKHGRKPSADSVHESQIEQRKNCGRECVDKISLRAIFEKVVFQGVVDEQRPWEHPTTDNGCRHAIRMDWWDGCESLTQSQRNQ